MLEIAPESAPLLLGAPDTVAERLARPALAHREESAEEDEEAVD